MGKTTTTKTPSRLGLGLLERKACTTRARGNGVAFREGDTEDEAGHDARDCYPADVHYHLAGRLRDASGGLMHWGGS